jgi:hypothetical protein
VLFDLEEFVYKGPAHIIDIIYKIAMRRVKTTVILNAVDTVVSVLTGHSTGKNV